jgi:excisionase family DNA binding protein
MSVDQVAAYTGVSPETLNTWRSRGNGPQWCKLGGKIVRYRRADIDAWIEGSLVTPNEAENQEAEARKKVLDGKGRGTPADDSHLL